MDAIGIVIVLSLQFQSFCEVHHVRDGRLQADCWCVVPKHLNEFQIAAPDAAFECSAGRSRSAAAITYSPNMGRSKREPPDSA